MHGMPLEYWEETTLFSIAYDISTLLSIDELMRKITWSHLARV